MANGVSGRKVTAGVVALACSAIFDVGHAAAQPLPEAPPPAPLPAPPSSFTQGPPGYRVAQPLSPAGVSPSSPGFVVPPPDAPAELEYEEGQPIPAGYRFQKRKQKGLIIGGAATFGGMYFITVLTGAILQAASAVSSIWCDIPSSVAEESGQSCHDASRDDYVPMYIPLAGPFVTMGTARVSAGGAVGLGVLGVGQVAGLGLLITGLATRGTVLVRNDVARPQLTIAPVVGKGTTGISFAASF